MFFCERLTEAEGEDQFAVGEVGDDLADAPFAGCWRLVDLCAGEMGGEVAEAVGCGGEDGDRVLAVEEFCVWIEFHGETVSRRVGGSARVSVFPTDRKYLCSIGGLRGRGK